MGADDRGCIEHDWHLVEAILGSRGADQVYECSWCPAVTYQPGQAALRDVRPPL